MENLRPTNENNGSGVNNRFFSKENINDVLGKGVLSIGVVLALAGLLEMVTGQKVGHLVEAYKDQIPGIINSIIANLDSIDPMMKTGGGVSFIGLGGYLERKFKKNE